MRVVSDPADLGVPAGRRSLVPTLGALHAGHLSLVELGKANAAEVVLSIFVNPTQFRVGEDFERYPRTPDRDLELCEAAGVDFVFTPSVKTMYPSGTDAVRIHVGSVGDLWEGAARPGHFDGVATIVTQLFLMVRPDLAVFSVKDLQQCSVISKLVAGLNLGPELLFAPTLRETDGLAMSSRNRYLSAEDRAIAPQLYQGLSEAKRRFQKGDDGEVDKVLRDVAANLNSRIDLQYIAVINRDTMDSVEPSHPFAWLIIAARLGGTRLIDNIKLNDE